MAKGVGGKTYEAIIKVVLDILVQNETLSGTVFWNKKPKSVSVEPDFLVGDSIEKPSYVFAVSHGDSPKESNRKCWRNISELCEMKTKLGSVPYVLNVIFDAHIKDDIKKMQSGAFDGQIIVEDYSFGPWIISWVAKHMKGLPKDQDAKVDAIVKLMEKDDDLSNCILELTSVFKDTFGNLGSDKSLASLWDAERARAVGKAPKAKRTCFKRGMAKRILVGQAICPPILDSDAKWMEKLILVKPTTKGYTVCDEELISFINSSYSKSYLSTSRKCMTVGFEKQLAKVKNFALMDIYLEFVVDHYEELITPEGMTRYILRQRENPTIDIEIPANIAQPTNIWLYDAVTSLIKAAEGKSQAFGYSFFATHDRSQSSTVGSMFIGDWCARFAGEFFNRKDSLSVPNGAIELMATVLSEYLSKYKKDAVEKLKAKIVDQYITKEYEKTYLSHRGFSPLQQILIDEKIITKQTINVKTCFAEKMHLGGQGGEVSVSLSKHSIIKCLSANKNPSDKRKELCGQATGLRYSWDEKTQSFVKRPNVEKLILLLDGTWTSKDLQLLINAGWDEIYYPDEIDKLKAAIV